MTSQEWKFADGTVRFGFSTKTHGDMRRTTEHREEVAHRRGSFLAELGLEHSEIALIQLTHSANVEARTTSPSRIDRTVFRTPDVIPTDFDNYVDGSDGIVTRATNVTVALVTADCIPLVVWNEMSQLHGIVHVGLLGAVNGVAEALGAAIDHLDVDRGDVNVMMGPSIGASDYDLTRSGLWEAIADDVSRLRPAVRDWVRHDGETRLFDMQGLVYADLNHAGFDGSRIAKYPISTADPRSIFQSHYLRKDRPSAPTERFMTAVGISQ